MAIDAVGIASRNAKERSIFFIVRPKYHKRPRARRCKGWAMAAAGILGFAIRVNAYQPRSSASASVTAMADMLTTPREVTEPVRIWAGRAVPSRMGPTGNESPNTLIV